VPAASLHRSGVPLSGVRCDTASDRSDTVSTVIAADQIA
jgi:hypothetical protein